MPGYTQTIQSGQAETPKESLVDPVGNNYFQPHKNAMRLKYTWGWEVFDSQNEAFDMAGRRSFSCSHPRSLTAGSLDMISTVQLILKPGSLIANLQQFQVIPSV